MWCLQLFTLRIHLIQYLNTFNSLLLPFGLEKYKFACCVCAWMLVSHIREECRLRVSENRVLRKIFGPGRKEVTGGWRKMSMEKLHDLNYLPNVVMVIK